MRNNFIGKRWQHPRFARFLQTLFLFKQLSWLLSKTQSSNIWGLEFFFHLTSLNVFLFHDFLVITGERKLNISEKGKGKKWGKEWRGNEGFSGEKLLFCNHLPAAEATGTEAVQHLKLSWSTWTLWWWRSWALILSLCRCLGCKNPGVSPCPLIQRPRKIIATDSCSSLQSMYATLPRKTNYLRKVTENVGVLNGCSFLLPPSLFKVILPWSLRLVVGQQVDFSHLCLQQMVSIPWANIICITTEMNILVNSEGSSIGIKRNPVCWDRPTLWNGAGNTNMFYQPLIFCWD